MRQLHPRQTNIFEIAKREGRVDVDALAVRFQVTPQTIRKDLNDLCEIKVLNRIHGGAVYPSSTSNFAYHSRRELAVDAKSEIASVAANLVPDNSSLFLNIGTTVESVAIALHDHRGLVAITNNLNVAYILSDAPDIEVVVAGGTVRKSDRAIVGAATVDLIKQFKVDFAIIGTSSIDEDGCLLDFDYQEVRVAQAILEQARTKILVADAMKFERRAPVQMGHLSNIDIFVTNAPLSEEIQQICDEANVRVLTTDKTDINMPIS